MSAAESPSSKSSLPIVPPEGDPGQPHLRLLHALSRAVRHIDPIRNRRIFVNRNLRMDTVDLIGFDMDYTLAIYNQPRIEALSVACTLQKMVDKRGYPQEILNLSYDPSFAIRGLVVDRQNGNVLKMDRYGYVGRCYHGSRLLSREERARLYREQRVRLSHPRYAWIDTLFALPEAVLYARNVELLDKELDALPHASDSGADPGEVRAGRYDKLWRDIRECIDEAHRDESMKQVIKADLAGYLEKDDDSAATLHRFRSSGKRLFLLTNSALDYTEKVMSYLLDGAMPNYPNWRHYFDAVVVDARKPAFFSERHPLFELGDDGRVLGQVLPGTPLLPGRVYQGGNVHDFQTQVGASGDSTLYVGDHIYGDMLRAKKSSVWRTAMILQELEQEMTLQANAESKLQQLEALERRKNRVESEIAYQQLLLRQLRADRSHLAGAAAETAPPALDFMDVLHNEGPGDVADLLHTPQVVEAAVAEMRRRLDALRAASRASTEEMDGLEADIDRTFNPYWGPLFKEGAENSRFGEQVEDYACLYTSRVSNFLAYSPLQYFRSPRDHLPHERVY